MLGFPHSLLVSWQKESFHDSFLLMREIVTASPLESELYEQIAPVVDGLGYSIVELRAQEISGAVQLSLVIYKSSGVGIDDCALVHETILPRAEVLWDRRDVRMEVSSPGTRRILKSDREFEVFVGQPVRVLTRDASEWVAGRIGTVRSDGFTLEQENNERDIAFSNVKKARLDDSQEVK